MTTDQYLAALAKLGLPPYGKATCEALGMSLRAIAGMASGERNVTKTVALLLRMYLRYGVFSSVPRTRADRGKASDPTLADVGKAKTLKASHLHRSVES